MIPSLKEKVIIKAGGLIEIRNPDLPEGVTAEVIVLLDEKSEELPFTSLSRFFGQVKNCFNSAKEADDFLRAERDAWEE